MENDKLIRLNNRFVILLLFLFVMFVSSFFNAFFSLFLKENVVDGTKSGVWYMFFLIALILTLLLWYFWTKKSFNLKPSRRKVLLLSSVFWFLFYMVLGSSLPMVSEYGVSAFIMISAILYFLIRNRIQGYSSKALLSISLGAGIIFVQLVLMWLQYYFANEPTFDLISILNSFFGWVPNGIPKILAFLIVLFVFSSFAPLLVRDSRNLLDSEEFLDS